MTRLVWGSAGRLKYEEKCTAGVNYGQLMAICDEAMHALRLADGSLT